jgi:hypothetical protein
MHIDTLAFIKFTMEKYEDFIEISMPILLDTGLTKGSVLV